MRKFIEPKIYVSVFSTENVLTASGPVETGTTDEDAAAAVSSKLNAGKTYIVEWQ